MIPIKTDKTKTANDMINQGIIRMKKKAVRKMNLFHVNLDFIQNFSISYDQQQDKGQSVQIIITKRN